MQVWQPVYGTLERVSNPHITAASAAALPGANLDGDHVENKLMAHALYLKIS